MRNPSLVSKSFSYYGRADVVSQELKWITATHLHMFITQLFTLHIRVKYHYTAFMVKYCINHNFSFKKKNCNELLVVFIYPKSLLSFSFLGLVKSQMRSQVFPHSHDTMWCNCCQVLLLQRASCKMKLY